MTPKEANKEIDLEIEKLKEKLKPYAAENLTLQKVHELGINYCGSIGIVEILQTIYNLENLKT